MINAENKVIRDESRTTRQYEINKADFLKFFKIKGKFQSIEVMTSKSEKQSEGSSIIHFMDVEPWIRVVTTEDTLNYEEPYKEDSSLL